MPVTRTLAMTARSGRCIVHLLGRSKRGVTMDITSSTRWAGAALVVAICSACSGGGTVAPVACSASGRYAAQTIVVDGRPITAERLNLGGIPRYPATAPVAGARTTSKHFDYVINLYTTYASIFDYPASTKQIGTIDDVGGQGC